MRTSKLGSWPCSLVVRVIAYMLDTKEHESERASVSRNHETIVQEAG